MSTLELPILSVARSVEGMTAQRDDRLINPITIHVRLYYSIRIHALNLMVTVNR